MYSKINKEVSDLTHNVFLNGKIKPLFLHMKSFHLPSISLLYLKIVQASTSVPVQLLFARRNTF